MPASRSAMAASMPLNEIQTQHAVSFGEDKNEDGHVSKRPYRSEKSPYIL